MRQERMKRHVGTCQCGCGAQFNREYTTRKPRYLNDTHRDRAERARARARVLAWKLCDEKYDGDIAQYSQLYWWYLEDEQRFCKELHARDTADLYPSQYEISREEYYYQR